MANEITINALLTFAKGNVTALTRSSAGARFDVAGTKFVAGVQSIGTTEEPLAMGEVETAGWAWMKNLDATNAIRIRADSASDLAELLGGDVAEAAELIVRMDLVELKAGETALFRLATDTPHAVAEDGPCELEYIIVED